MNENPYRVPPVTGPSTLKEKAKARLQVHLKPKLDLIIDRFCRIDWVERILQTLIASIILVILFLFSCISYHIWDGISHNGDPLQENWIVTCQDDLLEKDIIAAEVELIEGVLKVKDMETQVWYLSPSSCIAKPIESKESSFFSGQILP
jgi:hypothetical protein